MTLLSRVPVKSLLNSQLRLYSTGTTPLTNLKFFTKKDCQLCNEANSVLKNALNQLNPEIQKSINPVEYIDITKEGNQEWFESYRYDIPVLWVEREDYKKVVFMHRFDLTELVEELNQEL